VKILEKRVYWLIPIAALTLLSVFTGVALAQKSNLLTILHTNDIHSHLGRFSHLTAKIKEIRKAKALEEEPVLLLDSGDFLVGTLYNFLTATLSPELTLMNTLGYDATTLGNHEFDGSPQGLAEAINIARINGGGSTVPIVASNIQFNPFDSRDNELKELYDIGAVQNYLIKIMSNGIKVGIIGLLGKVAEQLSPYRAPLRFKHTREFIQDIVNGLRDKGVDLVVCLSHSGLDEDKELAKLIKGIDIIIAGHCHTALSEPLRVDDTLIVEAGSYTEYLGKLELSIDGGKVFLRSYQLIPIGDKVASDPGIQRAVGEYRKIIDEEILSPMGLAFASPVAEIDFDLMAETEFIAETNLGDLVTDAMRFTIDRYQPEDPVDFIFEPTGFIRGNILKSDAGIIETSDAFRVMSLGIGPDKRPGYPVVSFYLNIQEIKKILELSIYLSLTRGEVYLLQVSGLRFWYNPLRPIFRKIIRIEKWDSNISQYVPLDTSETATLYKVGTNLGLVSVFFSYRYIPGLSIIPKDKDGNYILPHRAPGKAQILVDKDPINSGVQELKEWEAFIDYLSHLPDLDGNSIPDIPGQYAQPQSRINPLPENILKYEAEKKTPWIAMGAALILPSLGHSYAEHRGGLKFLFLEIGSLLLMSQESTKDLGLLGLIAFKIWECKDAYEAVINYNKELAKKYHIKFSLNQDGIDLGLNYEF